jgi:hypothetical protein
MPLLLLGAKLIPLTNTGAPSGAFSSLVLVDRTDFTLWDSESTLTIVLTFQNTEDKTKRNDNQKPQQPAN